MCQLQPCIPLHFSLTENLKREIFVIQGAAVNIAEKENTLKKSRLLYIIQAPFAYFFQHTDLGCSNSYLAYYLG